MSLHNKNQVGFSLVEMLVAVSILLLVIVGPMTITTRTAKSTTFATEQVTAFFLAQEGLELAQKLRDDLLLRSFLPVGNANFISNPWPRFSDSSNTGVYRVCYIAGTGCGLEWSANEGLVTAPIDCTTGANTCLLRGNTVTTGRSHFTHIGGAGTVDTLYTRRIIFTPVNADSVRVNSIVTWRTGNLVSSQRVEVETYLYNIYVP